MLVDHVTTTKLKHQFSSEPIALINNYQTVKLLHIFWPFCLVSVRLWRARGVAYALGQNIKKVFLEIQRQILSLKKNLRIGIKVVFVTRVQNRAFVTEVKSFLWTHNSFGKRVMAKVGLDPVLVQFHQKLKNCLDYQSGTTTGRITLNGTMSFQMQKTMMAFNNLQL